MASDTIQISIINSSVTVLAVIITYVIAKQNRWNTGLTQFRQKWIDELRNAISLFITKAEMIIMFDLDDNKNYFEHFKELSEMNNRVELLLNPTEDDHNEIIEKMNEIREIIHDETYEDHDVLTMDVDAKIEELLSITKRVLKKEWNVVKKGK